MEFLQKKGLRPDILHLHNWQTALAAPLYYDFFYPQGFNSAKVVFTIHNPLSPGLCSQQDLSSLGLKPPQYVTQATELEDQTRGQWNLTKVGCFFGDFITTTSPSLAQNLLSEDCSFGLSPLLQKKREQFKGILNGIDYCLWNPETNPHISAPYSSRDCLQRISTGTTCIQECPKRQVNQRTLKLKVKLPEATRLLVACIVKSNSKKTLSSIENALQAASSLPLHFLLAAPSSLRSWLQEMRESYPQNDFSLIESVEPPLWHHILAGSDLLFTPCAHSHLQWISLKYGCLPLSPYIGDLQNNILDVDTCKKGVGFALPDCGVESLTATFRRALALWEKDHLRWTQITLRAMQENFSWNRPTNEYLELYHALKKESALV